MNCETMKKECKVENVINNVQLHTSLAALTGSLVLIAVNTGFPSSSAILTLIVKLSPGYTEICKMHYRCNYQNKTIKNF